MIKETNGIRTMQQLVARFTELAQQEKWFEIQEELFSEDAKSIDPPNSPYMGYAEGKAAIRKKAEDFVKKIETVHAIHTTQPVVGGRFISVGREMDLTVAGFGRISIDEIMLYEVVDGEIISEQFFY